MATETKPTEPAAAPAAPTDFTKMPGFNEAVAAAVAQSNAALLALVEKIGATQAAPATATPDVLSELTAAIVGITDPKNNERRISPAEAEKRKTAFNTMGALIMEMRSKGLRAKYKVVHQTFLGDQLIQPLTSLGNGDWADTEIIWNGAPSGALRPTNDVAHAIYDQYLIYIGGSTKNQAGAVEQPVWVSGNKLMVGTPNETTSKRGIVRQSEPIEIDPRGMMGSTVATTSADDGKKTIRTLGTIAEPARITDHFADSNPA